MCRLSGLRVSYWSSLNRLCLLHVLHVLQIPSPFVALLVPGSYMRLKRKYWNVMESLSSAFSFGTRDSVSFWSLSLTQAHARGTTECTRPCFHRGFCSTPSQAALQSSGISGDRVSVQGSQGSSEPRTPKATFSHTVPWPTFRGNHLLGCCVLCPGLHVLLAPAPTGWSRRLVNAPRCQGL